MLQLTVVKKYSDSAQIKRCKIKASVYAISACLDHNNRLPINQFINYAKLRRLYAKLHRSSPQFRRGQFKYQFKTRPRYVLIRHFRPLCMFTFDAFISALHVGNSARVIRWTARKSYFKYKSTGYKVCIGLLDTVDGEPKV